jgi:hypothetical protein
MGREVLEARNYSRSVNKAGSLVGICERRMKSMEREIEKGGESCRHIMKDLFTAFHFLLTQTHVSPIPTA